MLPRRRLHWAVATCLFGLAAFGCSNDDEQAFPPVSVDENQSTTSETTTTTATTTSSTTTDPPDTTPDVPDPSDGEAFDEYIAGRVEAFYELRDRATFEPSATPETDYPEFAELSADPQLQVMLDAIRDLHDRGRARREPDDPVIGTSTDEEHRTSGVITNEGDTVTVFDCEVDDDDEYDVETDELTITGVITILRTVTLERSSDEWKVTISDVSQKIEGVAGCYLAGEAEFPY